MELWSGSITTPYQIDILHGSSIHRGRANEENCCFRQVENEGHSFYHLFQRMALPKEAPVPSPGFVFDNNWICLKSTYITLTDHFMTKFEEYSALPGDRCSKTWNHFIDKDLRKTFSSMMIHMGLIFAEGLCVEHLITMSTVDDDSCVRFLNLRKGDRKDMERDVQTMVIVMCWVIRLASPGEQLKEILKHVSCDVKRFIKLCTHEFISFIDLQWLLNFPLDWDWKTKSAFYFSYSYFVGGNPARLELANYFQEYRLGWWRRVRMGKEDKDTNPLSEGYQVIEEVINFAGRKAQELNPNLTFTRWLYTLKVTDGFLHEPRICWNTVKHYNATAMDACEKQAITPEEIINIIDHVFKSPCSRFYSFVSRIWMKHSLNFNWVNHMRIIQGVNVWKLEATDLNKPTLKRKRDDENLARREKEKEERQ